MGRSGVGGDNWTARSSSAVSPSASSLMSQTSDAPSAACGREHANSFPRVRPPARSSSHSPLSSSFPGASRGAMVPHHASPTTCAAQTGHALPSASRSASALAPSPLLPRMVSAPVHSSHTSNSDDWSPSATTDSSRDPSLLANPLPYEPSAGFRRSIRDACSVFALAGAAASAASRPPPRMATCP